MEPWAQRIYDRLAELEPRGLTRAGLVRACGVKSSSVSGWFGEASKPTKMIMGDYLVAAARYLGVTAEWIITGRGLKDLPSQPERFDPETMDAAVEFLGIVGAANKRFSRITWTRILVAHKVLLSFGDDLETHQLAIIEALSAALQEEEDSGD